MKKIIFASSGIVHPPFRAVRQAQKVLEKNQGFTLSRIPSLEKIPDTLDDFSAIILYFHQKRISTAALDRLISFISNGGGLLGIHSATASFKQNERYFDLLGGRFSLHGKVEPITIRSVQSSDIFSIPEPISITDELYYHDLKDDISVHCTTEINGEEIPVVWTRQQGKGRVCYAMPGHTVSSMKHQGVQEILHHALDWVSNK